VMSLRWHQVTSRFFFDWWFQGGQWLNGAVPVNVALVQDGLTFRLDQTVFSGKLFTALSKSARLRVTCCKNWCSKKTMCLGWLGLKTGYPAIPIPSISIPWSHGLDINLPTKIAIPVTQAPRHVR
jgi:hypothetical protein